MGEKPKGPIRVIESSFNIWLYNLPQLFAVEILWNKVKSIPFETNWSKCHSSMYNMPAILGHKGWTWSSVMEVMLLMWKKTLWCTYLLTLNTFNIFDGGDVMEVMSFHFDHSKLVCLIDSWFLWLMMIDLLFWHMLQLQHFWNKNSKLV